jgi:hypothetical protein
LNCSRNQLSGSIPVIPGIEYFDCSKNHTEGGLKPHQRCLTSRESNI